jgi:hypothetical protein
MKYSPQKKQYGLTVIILFAILVSSISNVKAQVNSLYFMENVPFRNNLNPAFIPTQSYYLDIPLLSNISIWSGNSAVSASDIFFKQNGKLITPFHPDADRDAFLNILQPTSYVNFNYQHEILGFGFRVKKNYYTFGIRQRIESSIALPKDLMRLLLKGAPDSINTNRFNLSSLHTDVTAYMEAGLGFARPVNNRLTIGGKLKLLIGEAHADANFSKLNLDISPQAAILSGNGSARITAPYEITQNADGTPKDIDTDGSLQEPMGWGAGADLGATYKLFKNLTLSASITDLGFIHWKKDSWKADMTTKASFTGINFKINDKDDNNDYGQQIGDSVKNAFTYSRNGAGYTTWLTAKVRVGGEYNLVKNKITLGALWENTVGGSYRYSEVTGSINFRPFYFFNTTFSYGVINGNSGTLGLGVNLIGGPFNFYVATDYAPAKFTRDGIPYKTKYVNAEVGLVMAIRNNKRNKPRKLYMPIPTASAIDTTATIVETPVIMQVDPIVTAPVVIKSIVPSINPRAVQIPAEVQVVEAPVVKKAAVTPKKKAATQSTTRKYNGKTLNKGTTGVKRTGTVKTSSVKKATTGTQQKKTTQK